MICIVIDIILQSKFIMNVEDERCKRLGGAGGVGASGIGAGGRRHGSPRMVEGEGSASQRRGYLHWLQNLKGRNPLIPDGLVFLKVTIYHTKF